MQALNHAINDAALFRKIFDGVTRTAAPARRDIDAEVAAHNAAVDRQRYEKQRAKAQRRSVAERLADPL